MPSPHVPTEPAPKAERGLKFDTGKTRTDLLPTRAVDEVASALFTEPLIDSTPWALILSELGEWRRGAKEGPGLVPRMAVVAGAILVLLTRELKGDVRVGSILPTCGPALLEIAKVLTFGAAKYGANNWQGLVDYENRYYAALLRHLYAFGGGESKDSESGLFHLAHAGCCAFFLLAKEVGFDPHT